MVAKRARPGPWCGLETFPALEREGYCFTRVDWVSGMLILEYADEIGVRECYSTTRLSSLASIICAILT